MHPKDFFNMYKIIQNPVVVILLGATISDLLLHAPVWVGTIFTNHGSVLFGVACGKKTTFIHYRK